MGKTTSRKLICVSLQKHPHVRGEDPGVSPGPRFEAETPPRAWGRLSPFILFVCRPRNTPTCVGKTRTRRGPSCLTWKHPHVRGEDESNSLPTLSISETPPRAWGRLDCESYAVCQLGNTPTCVGKTQLCKESKTFVQKHPHVRGEDHAFLFVIVLCFRNTPTCVGKTNDTLLTAVDGRKHPHVRGEDLT